MSKRKNVIELQNKPENKVVRRIIEKAKPVEFAPIIPIVSKSGQEKLAQELEEILTSGELPRKVKTRNQVKEKDLRKEKSTSNPKLMKKEVQPVNAKPMVDTQIKRLRIFQASTPITRTATKFQKAAIVVRDENGKQLVELSWRDQMNEKTKDIWDYLCFHFLQTGEGQGTNEVLIRKREILAGSGVKSDRTFISSIYTLEDMGLIEVRRLSGNKEGNLYILTEEGREEIESYQSLEV